MPTDHDRKHPTDESDDAKQAQRAEWLEANPRAIQAYNQRVEDGRLFGDDVRTF
ncbi:Post-segregation antitoxin CcdA [compost metagenome]